MVAAPGAWLDNYGRHGWMIDRPGAGLRRAGLALLGLRLDKAWMAFGGSSASTLGIIATVGLSMFPFILPSVDRPALQPDGVEQLVQPPDAVHHADRHGDLPAADPALHRLGL
jgi:hypothetical protein